MSFASLSHLGQLAVLRPYVLRFAKGFGLDPVSMRVVNHAFNTTYRVCTRSGAEFALRININSIRQPHELRAETSWVESLGGLDLPTVARPLRSPNGDMVQFCAWPGSDRDLAAVCYSWLPGRTVRGTPGPILADLVGRATRALHHHARTLAFPPGAGFNALPGPLFGHRLDLRGHAEGIDLPVFTEVATRAEAVYEKLARIERIPIHFDLHFGNMKFGKERIYVFDFDDTVLAWPAIDSSVTHYYWRSKENNLQLDDAYWRSGVTTPEGQGISWEDHETLVAARSVFLANELVKMVSADIVLKTPKFLKTTELRLKDFLQSGRLDCRIRA